MFKLIIKNPVPIKIVIKNIIIIINNKNNKSFKRNKINKILIEVKNKITLSFLYWTLEKQVGLLP